LEKWGARGLRGTEVTSSFHWVKHKIQEGKVELSVPFMLKKVIIAKWRSSSLLPCKYYYFKHNGLGKIP
jgi:hypothetical protein